MNRTKNQIIRDRIETARRNACAQQRGFASWADIGTLDDPFGDIRWTIERQLDCEDYDAQ